MKTNLVLLATAAGLIPLTGCATKRTIPFRISPDAPITEKKAKYDHSRFAKIPNRPTSFVYRVILKAVPYTRKHAFYGNWAGSGNRGGRPIDLVDEIYRRHDIVYAEVTCKRTMDWADAAAIEALSRIDSSKLSPAAIAFRERAAGFFTNPAISWMGKPVTAMLRTREPVDGAFQSERDVRELFGLKGPAAERPEMSTAAPPMRIAALTSAHGHATTAAKVPHPPALSEPGLDWHRQLAASTTGR